MFCYKIGDDAELRLIELRHAEELNALITENFAHIKEWSAWLTEKERPLERTRTWIGQNLACFANNEGFTAGIWHTRCFISTCRMRSTSAKISIGFGKVLRVTCR